MNDSSDEDFDDDDFFLINKHVDPALVPKIQRGKYVDLAKLLPKEKILHDDGRLQMVNKDGYSFLVPVTEKETLAIKCFKHWEQAFEIYASLYLTKNPNRAVETLQYMHSIRSASATFVWDEVYKYDCCFRRKMQKKPKRSWGKIFQQAWSLYLKEKIDKNNHGNLFSRHSNGNKK